MNSQDIEVELDIENCAMLIMNKGKRETSEGIELQNYENIRTLREKESSKYLGILEAAKDIKEKVRTEYF